MVVANTVPPAKDGLGEGAAPARQPLKQVGRAVAQRREVRFDARLARAGTERHAARVAGANAKRAALIRTPPALKPIFENMASAVTCLCPDCWASTPVYTSHHGGGRHHFVCGACTGIIAASSMCPYCKKRPVFICPHGELPVYLACNHCSLAGQHHLGERQRPPCTFCNLELADGLLARFKQRAPLLAAPSAEVRQAVLTTLEGVLTEAADRKAALAFAEHTAFRAELAAAVVAVNQRFGLSLQFS